MTEAHADEYRIDTLARLYVVSRAIRSTQLVRKFDQLTGASLATQSSPDDGTIDQVRDRSDCDFVRFREFAEDLLWDRAPAAVRAEIRGVVVEAITSPSCSTRCS
jgi:hypothetical protein